MCNDDEAWCLFGNTQVNVKDMGEFNDFIRETQLIEIPLGGRKFTRISDNG